MMRHDDEVRPYGEAIYAASKKHHAPMWRRLREDGVPIRATWIDLGENIQHWGPLWDTCLREASRSRALVVYAEDGDVHEGALLEVGAAVLHGVPVFWVGHTVSSVIHHPLVRTCSTLDEAFEAIRAL